MKHNFFTHLSALLFIGAVLAFASSAQADSKYYICKTAGSVCTVTNADYANKNQCAESVNIYLETDDPGSTTGTCYATQDECRQACGRPPSFTPVSGSLQCTPINDSISLGASFYNGSNVSLFRGATLLTTFSGSTSSYQPFVDREDGLPGGVSHVYYLRNGATADSLALDKVSCVREKRQATITISVNGRGSVEGALSCSWVQGRCRQTFQEGAMFALKAVPEKGYTFSGWSSLCGNPQLSECLLQASRDMSLTATFSTKTYPLSLSFGGAGSGRVEVFYGNSPLAFPSSGPVSLTYPNGAAIKLVVVPAAGSSFVSWGGVCAGVTGTTCMVEMNDAKSVSATLAKEPTPPSSQPVKILPVPDASPTLPPSVKPAPAPVTSVPVLQTLTVLGEGNGTVNVQDAQGKVTQTCVAFPCTVRVTSESAVTLHATAAGGFIFIGWEKDCSAALQNVYEATCLAYVKQPREVKVIFRSVSQESVASPQTQISHQITLTKSALGDGKGMIQAAVGGQSCSSLPCTLIASSQSVVVVTAQSEPGSEFAGWEGDCNAQLQNIYQNLCLLYVMNNKSVKARFNALSQSQTYDAVFQNAAMNTGGGSIQVDVSGRQCSTLPCTFQFMRDRSVVVTAVANPDSRFIGWQGDCNTSLQNVYQNICLLYMHGPKRVEAIFQSQSSDILRAPSSLFFSLRSLFLAQAGSDQSYDLTVQKNGTGAGNVISSDGSIACGAQCNSRYSNEIAVTLKAIPDASNSLFAGWSGGCSEALQNVYKDTCLVFMGETKSVFATFTKDPAKLSFPLLVHLDGTGVVQSDVPGINCGTVEATGSVCQKEFLIDRVITLTASQRSGSTAVFSKWSGNCESVSGNTCVVRMTGDRTVSATFAYPPLQAAHPLSVVIKGKGVVVDDDKGIQCDSGSATQFGCSRAYIYGTTLRLVATSPTDSRFLAWEGPCIDSYKNFCLVRIDGPKTITATFQEVLQQKTLMVVSYGPGSVRSDKTGIACGSDCVEEFAKGASVVLSAAPQAGATFLGWNGACRGNGTCVVTLDKARFVYSRFRLVNATLTVKKKGFGSVSSIPAGLVCGNVCSSPYPTDTVVTLYATPLSGQVFSGWEGVDACKGREPRCILRMDKNQSATAVFVPASAF